jgi:hypothetical protein
MNSVTSSGTDSIVTALYRLRPAIIGEPKVTRVQVRDRRVAALDGGANRDNIGPGSKDDLGRRWNSGNGHKCRDCNTW